MAKCKYCNLEGIHTVGCPDSPTSKAHQEMGAILATQCDGSLWAVSISFIRSKYITENELPKDTWVSVSDLVIFCDTLYWREVMSVAQMIKEPDVTCAPDYNYGWQHADKRYDGDFNAVSFGINQAVEATMRRKADAMVPYDPDWI